MRDLSVKALETKFRAYFAIGEAISILLHPFAEVVLHDVESGRIVRIWNAFSKRKAGDPSNLEGASDLFTTERTVGPYEKPLPSQGRTKSMTAALYDDAEQIVGFFCINLDITVVDATMAKLMAFAETQSERLKPIYLNNLQHQINHEVRDFLLSINKTMESLTRSERIDLVGRIEAHGLFHGRSAIKYVATALGVSRASVYNLITASQSQAAPSDPMPASSGSSAKTASSVAAGQAREEAKPTPAKRKRGERV